jgi:hypothetical protein
MLFSCIQYSIHSFIAVRVFLVRQVPYAAVIIRKANMTEKIKYEMVGGYGSSVSPFILYLDKLKDEGLKGQIVVASSFLVSLWTIDLKVSSYFYHSIFYLPNKSHPLPHKLQDDAEDTSIHVCNALSLVWYWMLEEKSIK